MNIEQAFKLREEILAIEKSGTRSVIVNILSGVYKRYKEEAMTIALEDEEFLNQVEGENKDTD